MKKFILFLLLVIIATVLAYLYVGRYSIEIKFDGNTINNLKGYYLIGAGSILLLIVYFVNELLSISQNLKTKSAIKRAKEDLVKQKNSFFEVVIAINTGSQDALAKLINNPNIELEETEKSIINAMRSMINRQYYDAFRQFTAAAENKLWKNYVFTKLAEISYIQKDWKQSLNYSQQAFNSNNSNTIAARLMVNLSLINGNLDEASNYSKRLIKIGQNFDNLKTSAKVKYFEAIQKIETEKYDDAGKILKSAIEEFPSDSLLYELYAVTANLKQDFKNFYFFLYNKWFEIQDSEFADKIFHLLPESKEKQEFIKQIQIIPPAAESIHCYLSSQMAFLEGLFEEANSTLQIITYKPLPEASLLEKIRLLEIKNKVPYENIIKQKTEEAAKLEAELELHRQTKKDEEK